jgi:hypothetical protein
MHGIQAQTSKSEPTPMHAGSTINQTSKSNEDRPQFRFDLPIHGQWRTTAGCASNWLKHYYKVPLIPLRRVDVVKGGGGNPPMRARWVPLEGWWEEPADTIKLEKLLRADASLGIGQRLGESGPGTFRLVEILIKNRKEAAPALSRIFGFMSRVETASWRDEEGLHCVFLGYPDLAKFGPVVVGAWKGNGGNPHYAGLEIRLGPGDPSTSLVVLPPTPLKNGQLRNWKRPHYFFSPVGDRLEEDLKKFALPTSQFALATNIVADDPRNTLAAPRPDEPQEPSAPLLKRRKLVAHRELEARRSVDTPAVDVHAEAPQGTPCPLDLEALAAAITDEIRAGNASMSKGLDHFRRAGEMLHYAKLRIGHEGYERFVLEHFGSCLETANKYKRIFLGWSTVEEMRRANPASEPDLTLTEVLKRLAKPRKQSGTKGITVTPEAIDEVVPEASALTIDPDRLIPCVRSSEAARTDQGNLRTLEHQSNEVPPTVLMSLPAGDPIGPAMTGEAVPADELEVDNGPAGQCDAAPGVAPAGVVITEENRPRAQDLISLLKRCLIRNRLQKAVRRHFDADTRLWLLLQPITDEIRARHRRAGREDGLFATLVGDFLLGKPPEEWILCQRCGGAGFLVVGGKPCSECTGGGYRM